MPAEVASVNTQAADRSACYDICNDRERCRGCQVATRTGREQETLVACAHACSLTGLSMASDDEMLAIGLWQGTVLPLSRSRASMQAVPGHAYTRPQRRSSLLRSLRRALMRSSPAHRWCTLTGGWPRRRCALRRPHAGSRSQSWWKRSACARASMTSWHMPTMSSPPQHSLR